MKEAVTHFRFEYGALIKYAKEKEELIAPKEKEAILISLTDKQRWRKYRRLVWKITESQRISKLPNYEKRAFTGYHLDHKVSIWYGFKNKIDPKLIGSIHNLEFIYYKDNMLKSTKCNFKATVAIQTVMYV